MMETNDKTPAGGVQALIDRIREQGVQAAQGEADQLLSDARKEADEIVRRARAEADTALAKAKAEIEAQRKASLDALRLAARDTVQELKSRITSRFEEFVKRLVVSATRDKEMVRNLVLVLAGHAASEFIQDKEIEVRVSEALLNGEPGPVFKEEGKLAILGLASDMLREGLVLVPDSEIEGGVRVRLIADQLEIDLSDRSISRMISQRILPRFKSIVEGAE
jgi:V/A-type H+-transporting ATPase subunit E